jgi:hypothetical protein
VNDSKNVTNYTEFMGQAFIDKCQPINYNCSTREEIENIRKSLKLKNSYGYDEISNILKVSSPFIASPINYTGCNTTLCHKSRR